MKAIHYSAFGGGVPDWVHLVPAGRFTGIDGRGPYTVADPAAVIAASMAEGKLPVDENHSTDLAGPKGEPSPARGWIVEMQARDDGIWGRVEWTESGRALMSDQAYRGISPVFIHDKAGHVLRVLRAALTNTPNLADLAKLNSSTETAMDLARLRSLLGLGADASETAILAAIEAQAAARAAHTALVTSLQAQVVELQAGSIKPETVIALQTRIAELEQAGARERAVAFVDGAIKAGKPIVPLRDHYIARHVKDAAAVETEIGKLPSLHSGGMPPSAHAAARHDMADGDDLTAEDMAVCKKMGMDPKRFAEFKKKQKAA